jgi:hypothetical protein
MSVHENLTVAYHQQDTDYYCGAACAQMVLDEIGMGLLGQGGLYNDNHSHSVAEPGWSTAPDGLQWTMNHRQHSKYFALDALASEDAISRMIVWTIHHYKVAPIALVYGWAHWIVVRGYTATDKPKSSTDTSYCITAFDVNNPWPPCPSFYHRSPAHPPPHAKNDKCGTGGTRGVANQHISYHAWQSTYMTGVPGGHWGGKFVAVCDPDPPPTAPAKLCKPPMAGLSVEHLISPSQAVEQAMAGVRAYELDTRETFQAAMSKAIPRTPVLVERLDRTNSYYYIVPVANESTSNVPLAIIVDGRTGVYDESIVSASGTEAVLSLSRPEDAEKKLIGQDVQLPGLLGRLHVLGETLGRHPTMVWKPCRESLSPYEPFHLFTSGGHQIYVRSDGEIFTALHDQDRGA